MNFVLFVRHFCSVCVRVAAASPAASSLVSEACRVFLSLWLAVWWVSECVSVCVYECVCVCVCVFRVKADSHLFHPASSFPECLSIHCPSIPPSIHPLTYPSIGSSGLVSILCSTCSSSATASSPPTFTLAGDQVLPCAQFLYSIQIPWTTLPLPAMGELLCSWR